MMGMFAFDYNISRKDFLQNGKVLSSRLEDTVATAFILSANRGTQSNSSSCAADKNDTGERVATIILAANCSTQDTSDRTCQGKQFDLKPHHAAAISKEIINSEFFQSNLKVQLSTPPENISKRAQKTSIRDAIRGTLNIQSLIYTCK
jgi:hypothetical protein